MIKVTENNIWHESINSQDSYGAMVNMDKHLGVEIIEIGDDYVIAKMPVSEKLNSLLRFFMEELHVFLQKQLEA